MASIARAVLIGARVDQLLTKRKIALFPQLRTARIRRSHRTALMVQMRPGQHIVDNAQPRAAAANIVTDLIRRHVLGIDRCACECGIDLFLTTFQVRIFFVLSYSSLLNLHKKITVTKIFCLNQY